MTWPLLRFLPSNTTLCDMSLTTDWISIDTSSLLTGGQDRMMAIERVNILGLLSRRILCISVCFLQRDCLNIFHSFTCTSKPPGVLSPWHVLNQSCHHTNRTFPVVKVSFQQTQKTRQISQQKAISAGQGSSPYFTSRNVSTHSQ